MYQQTADKYVNSLPKDKVEIMSLWKDYEIRATSR